MIKKLKMKLVLTGGLGILHDSRQDVRDLATVCNNLIEKVNELVEKVNELENKEKSNSESETIVKEVFVCLYKKGPLKKEFIKLN